MRSKVVFHDYEPAFNVCPYSFNQCTNPEYDNCKIRAEAHKCGTTSDYVNVTRKARRCEFLGQQLTRGQYEHRRLGIQV